MWQVVLGGILSVYVELFWEITKPIAKLFAHICSKFDELLRGGLASSITGETKISFRPSEWKALLTAFD